MGISLFQSNKPQNNILNQVNQIKQMMNHQNPNVIAQQMMKTVAIQKTTEQTQKILDTLCGNRMADMQNQINQLQLQSAMNGVVRYPNGWSYNSGNSPFCGCNTGCCNI